jgi:hypothetical protein
MGAFFHADGVLGLHDSTGVHLLARRWRRRILRTCIFCGGAARPAFLQIALPSASNGTNGAWSVSATEAKARMVVANIARLPELLRRAEPGKLRRVDHRWRRLCRPQSSKVSRRTASLAGFFALSQSRDGPER